MQRLNQLLDKLRTRRTQETRARALRGMTLLEIMIVLAILALVMGLLVGPRVFRAFQDSKAEIARSTVRKFAFEAYPQWSARPGARGCPAITDLTEWMNNKDTKDPWGNEYVVKCGGDLPQGTNFGVMSFGPDGKDGTGDDLKSWD